MQMQKKINRALRTWLSACEAHASTTHEISLKFILTRWFSRIRHARRAQPRVATASFSDSRDKRLSRRNNIIDCHRDCKRESLNTRTCWSKEEWIAVNFSQLCRNFVEDVKLSCARILDLSLCRTLEMNPRKGWVGANTVLKSVAIYRRCENSATARRNGNKRLRATSLSTNTSTISRMPRAVRWLYIYIYRAYKNF